MGWKMNCYEEKSDWKVIGFSLGLGLVSLIILAGIVWLCLPVLNNFNLINGLLALISLLIGGWWIWVIFSLSLEMLKSLPSQINNQLKNNGLIFRIDEAGFTYTDQAIKIFHAWNEVEDVGDFRQKVALKWRYQIKFSDQTTYTFSGSEKNLSEVVALIEKFWSHHLEATNV